MEYRSAEIMRLQVRKHGNIGKIAVFGENQSLCMAHRGELGTSVILIDPRKTAVMDSTGGEE